MTISTFEQKIGVLVILLSAASIRVDFEKFFPIKNLLPQKVPEISEFEEDKLT